jgi:FkbM family methyltransferase
MYLTKTWNNREEQIKFWLRKLGIKSVIDVGANRGNFGSMLRYIGYTGEIHSYEPPSHAYAMLKRATLGDAKWIVHDRMAIGAETGATKIRVAGNSYSSSILSPQPFFKEVVAKELNMSVATVEEERVDVHRLDDVYRIPDVPFMLKIDTEGFEDRVLDGATAILPRTSLACIEMQLVPLYDGAATFDQIYPRLLAAGMKCVGLHKAFASHSLGKLLATDGIFVRE